MNNKLILATLGGAIAIFLMGWLLYGVALKDFFDGQVVSAARGLLRGERDLLTVFVGCLAWALLLALVYSRWATITTFRGGAIPGLWIGFLTALGFNLFMYPSMNVASINQVVVDPIVNAIIMAIGGGVVGEALGYRDRRPNKKR